MKAIKRKWIAAALALACLAGCGGTAASVASGDATVATTATDETALPQALSVLTMQLGSDPETLDPARSTTLDSANLLLTMFEPLMIETEDGALTPGQAESCTVSEDGLTWTLTLRQGLKWSDGTALTAKDFEYSFKRLMDLASPRAAALLGMIDGYDAAAGYPDANGVPTGTPDPDALNVTAEGRTLTIVLAYPYENFASVLASPVLSPVQQATAEENGTAWADAPETYISNGPYCLQEWAPGDHLLVARNPYYSGGWDSARIVTDQLYFLLTSDAAVAYTEYNSGDAQLVCSVPTSEIPSLTRSEEGGDFYLLPVTGTCWLTMDFMSDTLGDARVRQALSLAIDRAALVDTVWQEIGTPAYALVGPGVTDADGTPFAANANGGEGYLSDDAQANLEKAKNLLAVAGYPEGVGLPALTCAAASTGYSPAVAEYVKGAFAAVGVTLNIKTVTPAELADGLTNHAFEMAVSGGVCGWDDPACLLQNFAAGDGGNAGQIANGRFDAALQASCTGDAETRFAALHRAEDIAMENAFVIPLAYPQGYWLQDPGLHGVWYSANGYWHLQYAALG